jgi:hypothetical protein
MKIYFAIGEYDDLESHFDLRGVYFSKEDLFEDLSAIKEDGSSVYSCEDSMFINPKMNRGSLCQENMSELLEELNKQSEYKEYLRLKEKYEKVKFDD